MGHSPAYCLDGFLVFSVLVLVLVMVLVMVLVLVLVLVFMVMVIWLHLIQINSALASAVSCVT